MPFAAGTQEVTTAGTAEPLTNDLNSDKVVRGSSKVKSITVKARAGNTGAVYLGTSNVSSTYGVELDPGESDSTDFGDQSELFSAFYVDAEAGGDGNQVDWKVIIES